MDKDNLLVPLLPATQISVCQMRKSLKLSVRVEFQAGRVLPGKRLFFHPWTVQDCNVLYLALLGCSTGLWWAVLGCTELRWAVLGCTRLYNTVLGGTVLWS